MKAASDLKIPFKWIDRRPVLLEKFFYIPGAFDHISQTVPFFEKEQPLIIEYCSGNGQWVADRAFQNPHLNWLAVEKKFERARKIWLKLHRQELTNLCVVCGEGLIFTRYYAPDSVSEVYVNFPDPWPKRRHGKHRLIDQEFLTELGRILKPQGRVTCVTDFPAYAQEMQKEFQKSSNWRLLFYSHEWPDYGRSFFNDLWVGKGRTIHYLCHEKRHD